MLADRSYVVRLCFAEPEELEPGVRVFSVRLQGEEVLTDLDVVRAAGGPNRSVERHFTASTVAGALQIDFVPSTQKPPLICGVELLLGD